MEDASEPTTRPGMEREAVVRAITAPCMCQAIALNLQESAQFRCADSRRRWSPTDAASTHRDGEEHDDDEQPKVLGCHVQALVRSRLFAMRIRRLAGHSAGARKTSEALRKQASMRRRRTSSRGMLDHFPRLICQRRRRLAAGVGIWVVRPLQSSQGLRMC